MNAKDFIRQNKQKPLTEVALLLTKYPAINKTFVLNQINGIQKAKTKLPEFYRHQNIIYPSKLSMEQCSSEQAAIYKSKLVNAESMADLTGGLGVDTYYFSKKINEVIYVEQNPEVFRVAENNFNTLGAQNILIINSSAEAFIRNTKSKFDLIYIDPSRRNENKRVFKLNECTPNIIELASEIFKISNKILVKTAPFLDIKQSLKDLQHVTDVWVVSINNECKEVLYLMEKDKIVEPKIHTVNLVKPNQKFDFSYEQEKNAAPEYHEPKSYLYEPNSSLLKAGAFNSICSTFNIQKLAPNTHLYTSENLIGNFPGRVFKIENVIAYQSKNFKQLRIKKANISIRNFKDSVEQVKQKLHIKDGGEDYIFATTNLNKKPILICCIKSNSNVI